MNKALLLLLVTTAGLSGCIAPGTNYFDLAMPAAADTFEIQPGTCVAVTRINLTETDATGRPPIRLTINSRPSSGFAYGLFLLEPGTNFHAVVLKAGNYQWREMYMGAYGSIFRDDFIFECPENQITYIGDVDIAMDWPSKRYRMTFADRSRLAEASFVSAYPAMSAKNKFFSRPVRDPRLKSY